jgi:hypothetical protein
MTCFKSFLHQYKIPALPSKEVPAKCDIKVCKRIYYGQMPKNSERQPILDIAGHIKLVSDKDRKLLIAAIQADTKFK